MTTPKASEGPLPTGGLDSWGFVVNEMIVPGYYAQELLGGGTTNEAYLAFDELRSCLVVLKLLRPSATSEPSAVGALLRELQMLRRVQHPVVARAFDGDAGGVRPHIVLEYVEAPRLSTLLRRFGKLPVEQVLPLGLQLTSVLQYLRNTNVVHLDIKPQNIMMSGPPRLIDFSVATDVSRAATFTSPVGTRTYMSPEQCRPGAGGKVGPAADVWGLGAVLYEAVTGRAAFPRDAPHEHPQLHLRPAALPKTVPTPLCHAIDGCLDPRPENRPTPDAVAEQLEAMVAALPRRMVLSRLRPGSRLAHL